MTLSYITFCLLAMLAPFLALRPFCVLCVLFVSLLLYSFLPFCFLYKLWSSSTLYFFGLWVSFMVFISNPCLLLQPWPHVFVLLFPVLVSFGLTLVLVSWLIWLLDCFSFTVYCVNFITYFVSKRASVAWGHKRDTFSPFDYSFLLDMSVIVLS